MAKTIFGSIAILVVIVSFIFSRYDDRKSGRRWWEW